MKKILQYGRHLMHAKGRHGTHSPFVYTFVEQVLRAKAGKLPARPPHYPAAAYRLLYKTIKHLAPETLYALPADQSLLQQIADAAQCGVTVVPITGSLLNPAAGMLYLPCNEAYLSLIKTFLHSGTQVLLKAPHAGEDSLETWAQLLELPEVKVSLDYWHFGLLVNDAMFKARQHFRLR